MNQDCCQVLLIDDDEDDFLLTRAMLKQVQRRKIRLDWISGFEAGLEKVLAGRGQHSKQYDAVLVDYDLGRSTGIDLIRQAIQAGANVPFILLTGRSTLELDLEARKAGAGAFVPKSEISPILLDRSISFAIEKKQNEAQLKSAEEKARELIRYAPTAIYEIDLQTRRLIEVNDVMCTYLGYSRQELLEMDSASLLSEDSQKVFLDRIRRSLAGEEVDDTVEYKVRARDGRELFAVLKTTTTFKDGRPDTAMVIAHDVTERRRIERALKAHNERLQSYAGQLRRSNQLLADFAFNASHDLQEPLRKIQAFGELLAKGSANLLDEQSRDYITRMQGAAVRMRDLLTGLLEYSRVVNQENPFTQVDLNEIVADVLEDLEILQASTEGQVAVEKLPTLEADPIQMRELFQNLIGNALKFHRPGLPPQVKVRVEEQSGEAVTIIVADNGIGIDAQNLEAVFLPFKRLNAKQSYEGSGMGLAISRKIVERHEGSLSVDSALGQGATFRIHLPLRHIDEI